MNEALQQTCRLFVENRAIMYPKMIWQVSSNHLAIMSAFLHTIAGQQADVDHYDTCKALLKRSVSMFSEFRGIGRAMVITKMALSSDPEAYLNGSLAIYQKLRSLHKLTASPYMVLASMTLYEHGGLENADISIARLESLYKKEKAAHPFLIADADRGYLALIVAFCDDPNEVSTRIERCYEAAKTLSFDKDAVHTMAQVLSLSGKPVEQSIKLVQDLLENLKQRGYPVSKSTALPVLGALSMLDVPVSTLVDEIISVADLLRTQKGFKWYSIGGKSLRLYAALLVFMHHAGEQGTALVNGISATMTMVLIEQLIMMLIIVSATASTQHTSQSNAK